MFEVRETETNKTMAKFNNFIHAQAYAEECKSVFKTNYIIVKIEIVWSTQSLNELLEEI